MNKNQHHLSIEFLPSMEVLHWTKSKPTATGWYWCKQIKDEDPNTFWAAVVRVEEIPKPELCKHPERTFFIVTFLSSPLECSTIELEKWDDETMWAGPLVMPLFQKSDT